MIRSMLEQAASRLAAGMVVAIPTDTVYGLAVDPMQPGAVHRIFALKRRPGEWRFRYWWAAWSQVEWVAGRLDRWPPEISPTGSGRDR